MADKLFWVAELTGVESGEVDERRVFDDPSALGDYVRVNAQDMYSMRIAVASEANLTELRLIEAFTD